MVTKTSSVAYIPRSKRKIPVSTESAEEIALTRMMNQLPMLHYGSEAEMFKSAMYAAKAAITDSTLRRVFVQEFAASLNRTLPRILWNEKVEEFTNYGYEFMEASK